MADSPLFEVVEMTINETEYIYCDVNMITLQNDFSQHNKT